MAFFGFGAFSTPVGQLVEKATDNAASAGNFALHLQICDVINETDSGPKDAVSAIRKRLTGHSKNFHIINLTLTVLETCVKNCGVRFHSKIAQKDFLQDLLKVIAAKNNPPTIVKERVLGLIQYWADAFKGKPQLVSVEELYEQLKNDGIEFPPIDLDSVVPLETVGRPTTTGRPSTGQPSGQLHLARSAGGEPVPQASRGQRRPVGTLKPEQIAKLLSELDVVRKNIDIMNDVLSEVEPGKESEDEKQLLDDLNRVLHNMQTRVAGLIERCQDEIILEGTLTINDDLNTIFVRYERWMRNSAAAKGEPLPDGTTTTVSSSGVATTTLTDPTTTGGVVTGGGISYPNLDEPPLPPAYETDPTVTSEEGVTNSSGIGQLIDLGSEMTEPIQQPKVSQAGSDIISELAELGITSSSNQGGGSVKPSQQPSDDFDIFVKSRTAYGTEEGSTYDDNRVDQTVSLSAALQNRQQPQQNPYVDLSEWLAQTDATGSQQPQETQQNVVPADSATSAEFDQFLAQRASRGENLPAATRPRPQMQKAEDQSDELFQL